MTRPLVLFASLAAVGFIAFGILSHCYLTRFQGDGVYTVVTDALILRDHELVLPEFSLVEPGDYRWTFRGYCSGNRSLHFSLLARAGNDVEWWQVNTHVAATMRDDRGQILLERDSPLNAHHARNVASDRDGERYPQEWEVWYPTKGTFGITPSQIAREGIPGVEARYSTILERPQCLRTYTIEVRVSEPETSYGPLVGRLQLTSSWK